MDLYNKVSYVVSRQVTLSYSTSFGSSTKLFARHIRPHIYAIYGLVRIADEVVDTYRGKDARQVLDALEQEVYDALQRGYSTNPVIQSFALTARKYDITHTLIRPFFKSMAMDIEPVDYTQSQYETYIYGSAEVVGLMCLKVFVEGDDRKYTELETGARALGAAYQKVNFLRDVRADYEELGRIYFPGVTFEAFDNTAKQRIVRDIKKDFVLAQQTARKLPDGSRSAVELSISYYTALLRKIEQTPAALLKQKRVRLHTVSKSLLFSQATLRKKFNGRA